MNAPVGRHLLIDLYGVDAALLGDASAIEQALHTAARAAGATAISATFHRFGAGLGVTGVLLLRESHISIHTWPELGFAAVDMFVCGAADTAAALAALRAGLPSARCAIRDERRGGAPIT